MTMHKLREMLCDELDKITQNGELTAGSLDAIDKLTHSIKSIDVIEGMGYSGDGRSDRYYDGRMRGNSYARRRYSRDTDMADRIRELMDDADEKTRHILQRALSQME